MPSTRTSGVNPAAAANPSAEGWWEVGTETDAQYPLRITTDGKIQIGPSDGSGTYDTTVYRTAVGVLKTDGTFQCVGGVFVTGAASPTSIALASIATGDGAYRLIQLVNGRMTWGGGVITGDTVLYRLSAGVLATDTVFRTGVYTTAARPTAAVAGIGGQIYDTTLGKPIWSDGTVWRDAAGTAV